MDPLNWGDSGIKRLFKRVYSSLAPGGIFILEAWIPHGRASFQPFYIL